MKQGLIHIYCGDGKGKTSASVGLSVRALGAGLKVRYAQFFKDGSSSEIKMLESFENCSVYVCREQFGFYHKMDEEKKARAKAAFRKLFREVTADPEGVGLLVLDEAISAFNHEMIDREEVLTFLREKPQTLEVVLTGRDPAPSLLELASYVSEIGKIKHPFDDGTPARKGIEF